MAVLIVERKALTLLFWLGLSLAVITGFSWQNEVDQIKSSGQLFVLARQNPNTLYFNQDGATGFEYELSQSFADWLGADLIIRPENSHTDAYQDMEIGLAHLVTGITSPVPSDKLIYSRGYLDTTRVLLFKDELPENLELLKAARIGVQAASPSATWMQQNMPEVLVTAIDGTTTDILQMMQEDLLDYSVMDAIEYNMDAAFFPDIRLANDLTDPFAVRWAFRSTPDESLRQAADDFLLMMKNTGKMDQLVERFYGNLNQLSFVGINLFEQQVDRHLPKYRALFEEAAREHDLDWRLLAAIGFQESRWRPRAVSPTGVRGIMMLTQATSRMVGVTNRIDPAQSIMGGAKYFKRMTRIIPDQINEPDRTWMAMAAYNVGSGHLKDARKLTQIMGYNPDSWLDVMRHLPLLEQPEYYRNLEFGRARGSEPVKYVQNIRRYYDLLKWYFPTLQENPEMPEDLRHLPPIPAFLRPGAF